LGLIERSLLTARVFQRRVDHRDQTGDHQRRYRQRRERLDHRKAGLSCRAPVHESSCLFQHRSTGFALMGSH